MICIKFTTPTVSFYDLVKNLKFSGYDFLISHDPTKWNYVAIEEDKCITEFIEVFGSFVPNENYEVSQTIFSGQSFLINEIQNYSRYTLESIFPF